jgi:tetratricopeptide (TPR) repeat protein
MLGRPAESMAHCQRHLAIVREVGHRRGEAEALGNQGVLYYLLGDAGPAREHLEASLMIAREISYAYLEGNCLGWLGKVAEQEGDPVRAEDLLKQSLAVDREIGNPLGIGGTELALGALLARLGRDDDARRHLEAARSTAAEIGDPSIEVLSACHLAQLPGGDATAARSSLDQREHLLRNAELIQARFLLWKATRARADLEEAHRLLEYFREHAPEEYRDTVIRNVPLNREIAAAWEARGS